MCLGIEYLLLGASGDVETIKLLNPFSLVNLPIITRKRPLRL